MNYIDLSKPDKKILLANRFGIKLIYFREKHVVKLAIGMICVRLNPSLIQRIANIMMKASLQLDHIAAANRRIESNQKSVDDRPYITH